MTTQNNTEKSNSRNRYSVKSSQEFAEPDLQANDTVTRYEEFNKFIYGKLDLPSTPVEDKTANFLKLLSDLTDVKPRIMK